MFIIHARRSARNLPRWDEWQSKPRDYASREARDLSPSLDPRADYTVTLEDFETKRFLLLESLTMRHLFRETCHGSIRTAFRLEFFFFFSYFTGRSLTFIQLHNAKSKGV